MTVPGKRFQALDRETNVSTAVFSTAKNDIINDPTNLYKTANPTLNDMIRSASQVNIETPKVTSPLEEVSRVVKGAKASFQDLSELPQKALDDFLSEVSDNNPGVQKGIKNLLQKCSTKGAGLGLPGKPWDASLSCDGDGFSLSGSRGKGNGCDVSSMSDLLGRLTNGAYSDTYKDLNGALKKLMSLAGMGYNMGLCGVFGALSQGLPKEVLGKASGSLLGSFGYAGKTNAVLDLAKSATEVSALLHNPGAAGTFMDYFKMPAGTKRSEYVSLADRVTGGLELIKENWNRSEHDGTLASSEASVYQKDLGDLMKAKVTDKSFGTNDLDTPADNDDDFVMASYLMRA